MLFFLFRKFSKETYDHVMDTIKLDPDSSKKGYFPCHGFVLSAKESFEVTKIYIKFI